MGSLFSLEGKLAIVTGAASGIGAGIAEVLARAGALVIVADRNAEGAEQQAAAIRHAGGKAEALAVDLAQEASIVAAVAQVVERHGAPWALVNNAGMQDRELLLEASADLWDRTHAVNARGPFLMAREVARAMVAAGRGGRIVNIASQTVAGMLTPGVAAYVASKGAIDQLTSIEALELAPHRITANTVLPGGVMTPGAIGAKGPPTSGPATRRAPLGLSAPQDIGAAVLFFVSEEAHMVTNQRLAVDAGWTLS